LIDWLLLGAAAALIGWAFGWRVACLAAIWLGTSFPSRFAFTGGSLLRADWLTLLVATICFARRGFGATAGLTWAWTSLLRIFPISLGIGVVAHYGWQMLRARTWSVPATAARFTFCAAIGATVLVTASSITGGGRLFEPEAWRSFEANTERLMRTPFTNRIGLEALVSWRPDSRGSVLGGLWLDGPWDTWRAAQQRNLAAVRWLFWTLATAFLALLATACARNPAWVALTLSVGAIPIMLAVSTRYYGFLAVYAFLWPVRPRIGQGLSLLSLATLVAPAVFDFEDDIYVTISLVVVGFVIGVTAWLAVRPVASSFDAATAIDGTSKPTASIHA
jgi:hypothetical protein